MGSKEPILQDLVTRMTGRQFLVLSSLLFLIILITSAFFIDHQDSVWGLWKIPVMNPGFADLRVFTGAGESIKQGFDPLFVNPGDPWGRELNHPRIWQHIISHFNIQPSDTFILGVTLTVLFFIGLLIVFPSFDKKVAAVLLFLIFSPASMLAIERGNNDLLIFFLVCLALYFLRHQIFLSFCFLLTAAALKFFPIFAIPMFLGLRKRAALLFIFGASALFLTYLCLNWGDLEQIFNSTLKGVTIFAYGARSYFSQIPLLPSLVPFLALALVTVLYAFSFPPDINIDAENPTASGFIDSFRAGAGIYLGTFMLGNNWSYRLIFLILTMPQLIQWISLGRHRPVAVTSALLVLLSCWGIYFEDIPHSGAVDEIANWILVSTLAFLLLISRPCWIFRGANCHSHSHPNI